MPEVISMKKMLSVILVLCLLLPCAALAQSVRGKIKAPSHLFTSWSSPSGKSMVYVSAPVVIPEVEKIPLYRTSPCAVPEETVNAALKFFGLENIPREQLEWDSLDELNVTGYMWHDTENDQWITTHLSTWIPLDNRIEHTSLDFSFHQADNQSHAVPSEDEARKLADDLVNTVFPGHVYYSTDKFMDPQALPYRASYSQEEGNHASDDEGDYGYRFHYVSKVGAIPLAHVYCTADTGYQSDDGSYNYAMPYEILDVDVGADGIFQFRWESPFTLGEMISDDCKLLSFKKILGILGALAPKEVSRYENSGDHANILIDRIELSYMILPDKDNPESHILTPVWDFFGSSTFCEDWYDETDMPYFTINAIDGTVIDREYAR